MQAAQAANAAQAEVDAEAVPVKATWADHGEPSAILWFGVGAQRKPNASGTPAVVKVAEGKSDWLQVMAVERSVSTGHMKLGSLIVQISKAGKFWAAPVAKNGDSAPEPIAGQCHVRKVAKGDTADGHHEGDVTFSRTFADPGQARGYMASQEASGEWDMELVGGRPPRESLPGKLPGSVTPTQSRRTSDLRRAAGKLNPCHCGCGAQVKNLFAQGHDARWVSQQAEKYRTALKGDVSEAKLASLRSELLAQVKAISLKLEAKLERSLDLLDEKAAKVAG
jgi:hypothetical protein